GFLCPERCVVAHMRAALAHGAVVRTHERVAEWTANDDGVVVTTDSGRYRATRLVITAGPWLASLVPTLASRVKVERQVVLWTRPLRPEWFAPGRFPVFYVDTPHGAFYGFPADEHGFKIGKYHHRREVVDPDGVDRTVSAADEATLREGIASYFPEANGPTVLTSTCLFTN